MGGKTIHQFQRVEQNQRLKRTVFHFVAEGILTEIRYLENLSKMYPKSVFNNVKNNKHCSSPKELLCKINNFEETNKNCKEEDFLLVIADCDNWNEADIRALWRWQRGDYRRMFLFSNPCFELWILRHYESGNGLSTCAMCLNKLKHYGSSGICVGKVTMRNYKQK